MVKYSQRDKKLQDKWQGLADHIPVNDIQHNFDTAKREHEFFDKLYSNAADKLEYVAYREEWFRRPKEFDPGEAPLAIVCELVSTCNLSCSMCYTVTEEFQNSVVGAQRMMPWPMVRAIVEEAAEIGVKSILFSWRGESSLYRSRDEIGTLKRLSDALALAREKGILEVTCLTHGQTIEDDLIDGIVRAEPNWISISVDGLAPVYNKIRTPKNRSADEYNAFEKATNTIKKMVACRERLGLSRPQIRTNTIFPAICDNPDAYIQHMRDIGVDWVTANEIMDFRGDELPIDAIVEDWACQYPFQRLTVSANGTVLPCTGAHNEEEGLALGKYWAGEIPAIQEPGPTPVSIRQTPVNLMSAWHSPKIKKIRAMHQDNRRMDIDPGCRNCRHGAKHHGLEWIPEDWDTEKMEWKEGAIWRE